MVIGMEMMCRHLNEKCALVEFNFEMLFDVILFNKSLTNLDLSVIFFVDTGITKLSAAWNATKASKQSA